MEDLRYLSINRYNLDWLFFSEIVDCYNREGKTAAYDLLRSKYGSKNPYFVIKRIKRCGAYTYKAETDQFIGTETEKSDDVFMGLDEFCGTALSRRPEPEKIQTDNRAAAMERLVHELINDRLLTLSRYITIDSSSRTVFIDQTSLSADGYQVISH